MQKIIHHLSEEYCSALQNQTTLEFYRQSFISKKLSDLLKCTVNNNIVLHSKQKSVSKTAEVLSFCQTRIIGIMTHFIMKSLFYVKIIRTYANVWWRLPIAPRRHGSFHCLHGGTWCSPFANVICWIRQLLCRWLHRL